MNFDLEYDYAEALRRQGHKQADVDELRDSMREIAVIPKSITNKQVRYQTITETYSHIYYLSTIKCP